MKKILFSLLAGATMFLGSCSKESEADSFVPTGTETTFTISVAELQTRAASAITPTRYVMEVYDEAGTNPEAVIKNGNSFVSRLEVSNSTETPGAFTAYLDKTKTYTCLFWADGSAVNVNNGVYDASSLKAVKLNTGNVATEAYYAKINSKGKNPTVSVTLKRAVAKVTLVEKTQIETTKNIVVTYPNNILFNLLDGMVSSPTEGYTSTVTPRATIGVFGEFYMLSSVSGANIDMSITYDGKASASLTNVPIKQNFNTNIRGDFSELTSKTFAVTTDDTWLNPDHEALIPADKMMFSIDLSGYPDDKTYIIPFTNTGTTPCALGIEWGDGDITILPKGTNLATPETAALLKHTYTAAMKYQITIITVASAPQQQMPDFRPGFNRRDNNRYKLKSMDSPMLNTAATDFSSCFAACSNLTGAIPAALFEKNTAATNFSSCFASSGFTGAIPAALFEKNTAAQDFSYCFSSCNNLTGAIPAALFEKNTVVTDFSYCFNNCSGLTAIPAALFEKNTAATNFSYCFYYCSGLTAIPAALFETNTAATNFFCCFYNCTKATLNTDIFCTESEATKANRFLNKSVNFKSCFEGCGFDLLVTDGSTAPALWDYAFGTGTPEGDNCFKDVTNVTNYDQIPKAWGGPLE